jgi:glutamyl-tRNA synthetase
MNRDIIDQDAVRLFFVRDPVEKRITGVDKLHSRAPLHPERPELGTREINLEGDMRVFLTREDCGFMETGAIIRLKDLGNVEVAAGNELKYIGNDLAMLKQGVKIVHWAGPDSLPAEVRMPDGSIITGRAERAALGYSGKVVQFERFGFVRLDSADESRIVAFFTHK